jgi:DNA-binding MarR family transcriptional regulator
MKIHSIHKYMPNSPHRKPARFIDGYLSYLLAKASFAMYHDFGKQVAAAGMTSLEWRVLATLHDAESLTVGDLSKEILAKQPTTTKLLARMEKRGWVQRLAAQGDARQVLVEITMVGRNRVTPLLTAALAHEREFVSGLSDETMQILKSALAALVDSQRLA